MITTGMYDNDILADICRYRVCSFTCTLYASLRAPIASSTSSSSMLGKGHAYCLKDEELHNLNFLLVSNEIHE